MTAVSPRTLPHRRRHSHEGRATRGRIDLEAAELAIARFLVAMGQDPDDEHLRDAPRRLADIYADLLTQPSFEVTTFPNDEGYEELVLARDIPFRSLCRDHLLPFGGLAHVAYLPGDRVLGLSKMARVVDLVASRPQLPEGLSHEVADWLDRELEPKGVGVVIAAEHDCVGSGNGTAASHTVSSSLRGRLREDDRTRAEFFALVGV